MKRITALLLSVFLLSAVYAAEQWQLKHLDGDRSTFDGKAVRKNAPDGMFVLTGSEGFAVEPGKEYILDFQCRIEKISDAYVNFYLLCVDSKGKSNRMLAFATPPGPRGLSRDRMTRLEVASDHFLTHRMRFKAGKNIVRVLPVFEASDGTVTLYPGKMSLSEKLNRPDVVAEFTADELKQSSGDILWRTFALMPEVEYALESSRAAAPGKYALQFVSWENRTIGEVPLAGKVTHFKLPEECVETVLVKKGDAAPFSGRIRKDFQVDFRRGVYQNEWQGMELNRGGAQGKQVCFRRSFQLKNPAAHAKIRFLGHNSGELFVNGKSFGSGNQFNPAIVDITNALRTGENVIAIVCRNRSGVLRVLFDAYIQERGGNEQLIVSDARTKYSLKNPKGSWQLPGYDDSAWLPAVIGGSPKDFGDSIIAARVNNRHERLYIGPNRDLGAVRGMVPAAAKLGAALPVEFSGNKEAFPETGRLIFRAGEKVYETRLTGKNGKFSAVPRYLPVGKYSVAAAFDRCVFSGKAELMLGETELLPGDAVKPAEFEVKRINGKALLTRNGEVIPAAMYCHGQELSVEVKRVNDESRIKLHMFWIEDLERDSSGKFDLSNAETSLQHMLKQIEHDPDAYIMVCASFRPPKRFAKREKYQRELTLTSKGEKLRISHRPGERKYGKPYTDFAKADKHGFSSVSHASKLKIKDYCDAVESFVKYFEASAYASKIIGYGFSGEMDGQWHLYAPYSGSGASLGMVDYSPVMLDFFRAHLRSKYADNAALQRAWQDQSVTFDNAMIPGYDERVGERFFVSRRVQDYNEAFALAESQLISSLSASARKELKRKAIVWVYTKDSYRDVGLNQFLPHVLNSGSGFEQYTDKNFDACGNPTDYYFRQNGLHPANRGCHASAHLNKKIKLLEMDLRSYLTQAQQKVWGGDTAFATVNHFRNVLMEGFQYGSSYRFYSFWLGWYNNKAIHRTMARMGEIEKAQLTLPERWKKRVCHFYDDRAITHIGNFDDKGVRMRHYYFAKALTGVGANTLNRSGVGFDTYYLRDLLNPEFPADQYDVYIFNSCFQFDAALLAAVDKKLRKPGKVLIFPWGNGFLDEAHKPSADAVKELTGIAVAPHKLDVATGFITVTGNSHKLLQTLPVGSRIGSRHRYNITPQLPMFKITDPEAFIAGKNGDGSAGLAVKEYKGATSILCNTPDYSGALLRSVCRALNIHVFAGNSTDFVASDGNYLGIHSASGGEKVIPLPEKIRKATDIFSGEVVSGATSQLHVPLRDDETRILRLEY